MDLKFVGTGAAFDPDRGNVSFLYNGVSKILVDCGFMNVGPLIKLNWNPNFLDGIYISHSHADHFSGLVPLVSVFISKGRTKPLKIIGHYGLEDHFRYTEKLTEREMYKNQKFNLEFLETVEPVTFNELTLSFAKTFHGEYDNYAIKIDNTKSKVAYSGDGKITDDSLELFHDCNYLIHNVRHIDAEDTQHATLREVLDGTAPLRSLTTLCVAHLLHSYSRDEARLFVESNYAGSANVLFPEPKTILELD